MAKVAFRLARCCPWTVGAFVVATIGSACTGSVGYDDGFVDDDGLGVVADPSLPSFACNKSQTPPSQPLKKLTGTQYSNTLRDLLTQALGDESKGLAVFATLSTTLGSFPVDKREVVPQDQKGSFRRLDQSFEQGHIDGAFDVAKRVGLELTSKHLGSVAGACAVDSDAGNDATCLTDFIDRFGKLALRRPLSDSERQYYRSIYGTSEKADAARYANAIAAMLVAPQFIFLIETDTDPVEERPDSYKLSNFELASRLSYQFWDTMPDAMLFAAAEAGELTSDEGFGQQLDRLLADPRARMSIGRFAATTISSSTLSADLRDQMIDEIMTMLEYLTFDSGGNVDDLLLDDRIFVKGSALADLYGVSPWDGASEPQRFASGERPGLLTRSAFHTFGSPNSRPFMKGVFTRHAILCDELPSPPADAAAQEPVSTEGVQSTRALVEKITEQPGSS